MSDLSPIARGLLAFGLATFAAVAWECGEFLLDAYHGASIQRGLPNTMRDLFLGVGGAVLYLGTKAVVAKLGDQEGARCTRDS